MANLNLTEYNIRTPVSKLSFLTDDELLNIINIENFKSPIINELLSRINRYSDYVLDAEKELGSLKSKFDNITIMLNEHNLELDLNNNTIKNNNPNKSVTIKNLECPGCKIKLNLISNDDQIELNLSEEPGKFG